MMPRSTPTLGYPSRTAAVVALRHSGLMTHEIAQRIGISANAVTALEYSARKRDTTADQPPAVGAIRMAKVEDYFSIEHQARLRPHADRRQMSVGLLIKTIVRTVAESDLVDTVLDDGESEAAEPSPPVALPAAEPQPAPVVKPEPKPEPQPEPAPEPAPARQLPAPEVGTAPRSTSRIVSESDELLHLLRRAKTDVDGSALFMTSFVAKRFGFTEFRLGQILDHLGQVGEIDRRACSLKDHFRIAVRAGGAE